MLRSALRSFVALQLFLAIFCFKNIFLASVKANNQEKNQIMPSSRMPPLLDQSMQRA